MGMFPKFRLFQSGLIFALTLFGIRVLAQGQRVQLEAGNGAFHFQTKLGSFKLLTFSGNPVTGTLTMTFKGSVLVSGATHPAIVSGNVKQEYENTQFNKTGYHGAGTLKITGPFQSLEWFGSDLTAVFVGRGKMRLDGEFDKNLSTGTYWTTDPKVVNYWPANSTLDMMVPPFVTPGNIGPGNVPISRQKFNQQHKKKGL